jgi:hypothetical protein
MKVHDAIEAPLSCLDYIYLHDGPVKARLDSKVVREGLRLCRGQGRRAEAARALARDAEQAHAVSICSAAYAEYEVFLEQRLDRRYDNPAHAQAIDGLLATCKGRLRDLAR